MHKFSRNAKRRGKGLFMVVCDGIAPGSRRMARAWTAEGARCALIVTRRGWRVSLRHWRRQRDEIVSMSPLDYVEPVIHVDGA